MTDCKNCKMTDEYCASGDCPNDNTLTEQWKKGELPSGWYYTKLWKGCNVIDYFIGNQFLRYDDSDIVEVLAPVPSYDEWKAAQEQLHKEGIWYTEISHKKVLKENAQLKELLKECFIAINEGSYFDQCDILKKIDEVLK